MKRLVILALATFVFACNSDHEDPDDLRFNNLDYVEDPKIRGIRALWDQYNGDSITLKALKFKNQYQPYDSVYFYKVIWDSLTSNGTEVMEERCGLQQVIQVVKWVRLEDTRFIRELGTEYDK